ncbi:hypothetical protein C1Y40_03224 [Mycobacterium talmoniae]|nr:hypothetical protein C1Y40_03224 [Mycobacterium talmoniae]
MSVVSARESSYDPRAMLARVEKGETVEITRHGTVIATVIPSQQKKRSRIEELVASGAIRLSGKTTSDLDTFTQFEVDPDVDPLQVLFEDRYGEREWEGKLSNEIVGRGEATEGPV